MDSIIPQSRARRFGLIVVPAGGVQGGSSLRSDRAAIHGAAKSGPRGPSPKGSRPVRVGIAAACAGAWAVHLFSSTSLVVDRDAYPMLRLILRSSDRQEAATL